MSCGRETIPTNAAPAGKEMHAMRCRHQKGDALEEEANNRSTRLKENKRSCKKLVGKSSRWLASCAKSPPHNAGIL